MRTTGLVISIVALCLIGCRTSENDSAAALASKSDGKPRALNCVHATDNTTRRLSFRLDPMRTEGDSETFSLVFDYEDTDVSGSMSNLKCTFDNKNDYEFNCEAKKKDEYGAKAKATSTEKNGKIVVTVAGNIGKRVGPEQLYAKRSDCTAMRVYF